MTLSVKRAWTLPITSYVQVPAGRPTESRTGLLPAFEATIAPEGARRRIWSFASLPAGLVLKLGQLSHVRDDRAVGGRVFDGDENPGIHGSL